MQIWLIASFPEHQTDFLGRYGSGRSVRRHVGAYEHPEAASDFPQHASGEVGEGIAAAGGETREQEAQVSRRGREI